MDPSSNPHVYSEDRFMNPGPAPRPPTAPPGPRSNTPGAMSNLAPSTSFDQMTLGSGPRSPAPTIHSSASFAKSSSLSLISQRGQTSAANIVKEGSVRCKDDSFWGGWSQRYLMLRETNNGSHLEFLKNEQGKTVLSIALTAVTSVARSEEVRMAFEITRFVGQKDASPKATNRNVPTKTITCEVKSDEEIYDWVDRIYERCPLKGGVSNPTNYQHRVHVGYDQQTGGFVGLPTEWERLLNASAITKEDYQKNPQAVIEVLEFYSDHKKREQNPEMYGGSSKMPTASEMKENRPPNLNGVGTSVAPPRPNPPARTGTFPTQYQDVTPPRSGTTTPRPGFQRAATTKSGYDMEADAARIKEIANQEQARRQEEAARKEEARRAQEAQRRRDEDRQREREQDRQREEDMARKEQDAYNASLPQSRTPLAQQEIGGGGYGEQASRYNPARAAPQAPGRERERHDSQSRANNNQMGASGYSPSSRSPAGARAPDGANGGQGRGYPSQDRRQDPRDDRYRQDPRAQQSQSRNAPNGSSPSSRLPGPVQPVKPLNVTKQAPPKQPTPDARQQAEAALTSKKPAEERSKEVRMSSMTESEVMAKLKQVVSRDNPLESYSKQKKIGQGASGSVYVGSSERERDVCNRSGNLS